MADHKFRFLSHSEFQKLSLVEKMTYIRRASDALKKMRADLAPEVEEFRKKMGAHDS